MQLAAALDTFSVPLSDDRRSVRRFAVGRTGTLSLPDDLRSVEIRIADLNRDGCRIETTRSLLVGQTVVIGIPGVGQHEAEIGWIDARGGHGCRFAIPLLPGSVTAAMTDNVHQLDGTAAPLPAVFKWHPRARAALLVALSLTCWSPIIAIVALVAHLHA